MLAPLLYNELSGGGPSPPTVGYQPTLILTHVSQMHQLSRILWIIGACISTLKLLPFAYPSLIPRL